MHVYVCICKSDWIGCEPCASLGGSTNRLTAASIAHPKHTTTGTTTPQPPLPLDARPIQDGYSGQMAWLPTTTNPTTNPPDKQQTTPAGVGGCGSYFFRHVAARTTPFGNPQRPAAELLVERGLDPSGLVDALVRTWGCGCVGKRVWVGIDTSPTDRLTRPPPPHTPNPPTTPQPQQIDDTERRLNLPRVWPREPFTSALETLLISPARAVVVRTDPPLLAAGTDPFGGLFFFFFCVCVRVLSFCLGVFWPRHQLMFAHALTRAYIYTYIPPNDSTAAYRGATLKEVPIADPDNEQPPPQSQQVRL